MDLLVHRTLHSPSFLDLFYDMIQTGKINVNNRLVIRFDSQLCRRVRFNTDETTSHFNFIVRVRTSDRVYKWERVSALFNCAVGTIGQVYARRCYSEAGEIRRCMEFIVDDSSDTPVDSTMREQWINNLTSWFGVLRALIYGDIKDTYNIFQLGYVAFEFAQIHTLEVKGGGTGGTINILCSNTNIRYEAQLPLLIPSEINATTARMMGYTPEQWAHVYRIEGLNTRGKRKRGDECKSGTYWIVPVDNCTHACGATVGPTAFWDVVLCRQCSNATDRHMWIYNDKRYRLKKRSDGTGYNLDGSLPWSVIQSQIDSYEYNRVHIRNPVLRPRFMDLDESYDTPSDRRARIFYAVALAIRRQTTNPTAVSHPLAQLLLTIPLSPFLNTQPLYGSLYNLHDQIMLKRAVNAVIKHYGKLPESVSNRYYSGNFDVKVMFQDLKALLPSVAVLPDTTLPQ